MIFWIQGTGYSGYTCHQLDHQHDQKSEINELSASLNWSRMAQLLVCQQAELLIQGEATTPQTENLTDLKEAVKRTKKEEIDVSSSKITHDQTNTILLENSMHVITQALKGGDGPHLPQDLSVVNTYTELISGSKWAVVVVKNLMAILITITKGIKVTQVIAVNAVPPVELAPGTLEELDEVQGIQWTKMLVERRREVFLQQLDLSHLEGWSKANQTAAYTLLAEYHDIFSLEPGELGCINLAKHNIRVVDNKPFKEHFERIPPPMVEKVWAHLKEMLEVGAICPSQSL